MAYAMTCTRSVSEPRPELNHLQIRADLREETLLLTGLFSRKASTDFFRKPVRPEVPERRGFARPSPDVFDFRVDASESPVQVAAH